MNISVNISLGLCVVMKGHHRHLLPPSLAPSSSFCPTLTSTPPLERNDETKLAMICRHESIFNTNEAQTWMWGTVDKPAILPKTKGSGIMASDFIKEHSGNLCLSLEELERARRSEPDFPQKVRELLEYGAAREG